MASLIFCKILKIIQINEINEQILTSRHAFHFPFSSLCFLSLNMETSIELPSFNTWVKRFHKQAPLQQVCSVDFLNNILHGFSKKL